MKVKFYIEEKYVCVCCQLHFSERKFKYAKKTKKQTVFKRSNLTYRIRKKEQNKK